MTVEQGHQVDLELTTPQPRPLLLTDGARVRLTWSPQAIVPQVSNQVNLDLLLYTLDADSAQWEEHSVLISNTPNDGTADFDLPADVSGDDVIPIAIQVATSLDPGTSFASSVDEIYRRLFNSRQRAGIWTSQFYLTFTEADGMQRRQMCLEWSDDQPESIPDSTPCPPTLERAQLASSGVTEVVMGSALGSRMYQEQWMETFHPEAERCFREAAIDTK